MPVLDARSASRFAGEEVEPRPGVRPGHIPGSSNLHYAQILTGEPTTLKPLQELEQLFDEVGAGRDARVVTTCGRASPPVCWRWPCSAQDVLPSLSTMVLGPSGGRERTVPSRRVRSVALSVIVRGVEHHA